MLIIIIIMPEGESIILKHVVVYSVMLLKPLSCTSIVFSLMSSITFFLLLHTTSDPLFILRWRCATHTLFGTCSILLISVSSSDSSQHHLICHFICPSNFLHSPLTPHPKTLQIVLLGLCCVYVDQYRTILQT